MTGKGSYVYPWDHPHAYEGAGGEAPCCHGWEPPDAGMCRRGQFDPLHGGDRPYVRMVGRLTEDEARESVAREARYRESLETISHASADYIRKRLTTAGQIVHTLEAMWEDAGRGVNRILPESTYVQALGDLVAAWKESE